VIYADGRAAVMSRAALIAQFGGAAVTPPEPARPMQTATDAQVTAAQLNLANLRQPLLKYSNNNRGRLPVALGELYPLYVSDPNVFRSPRTTTAPAPSGMTRDETVAWINAQNDYIYLGVGGIGRRTFSGTPVLMYENPAEMPTGIHILFNDGRVEFREMRWALETIAAAKAAME
jgi:hypothetical protein